MIKVGIVDDHVILRTGLRHFLAAQGGIYVAGEASSGRAAIDLVRTTELDVLILDLSMPGQSGLDALSMIKVKAPGLGILILSGYGEQHYAVAVLRQGADGYLHKGCEPGEIVEAVRTISNGRRYITPVVSELLLEQLDVKKSAAPHQTLSDREFQVFLKLAKGGTASQMARELSLSVKTVSTYRTRLLEKMALHSNSDLTYYALKHNLID